MNFTKMQERLLVRLYHLTMYGISDGKQNIGVGIYFIDFIFGVTPSSIPNNLVSKLLEGLVEDGFAQELDPEWNFEWRANRKVFELTSKGLKHIEHLVGTGSFGIWDLSDAYEEDAEWVRQIIHDNDGSIEHQSNTAPASDRTVSLDHNSAQYQAAISALDDVIANVRGDNEYGDRDSEDKEQSLVALSAGRKLFDAGRVSVEMIDTVVLRTLAYLAGIGVAVDQIATAILKVKELIGL